MTAGRRVLGISDFFYVRDHSYDDLAALALPHYHLAHERLVQGIDRRSLDPFRALDLGIGSGVTAAYILKNFSRAHVTGVDLFSEMLADAEVRLAPFVDRTRLIQSDIHAFLDRSQEVFEIVVSGFCVHHQDGAGKRRLFDSIYDHLAPGGQFAMLDLTTFSDPHLREVSRAHTIAHMSSQVHDQAYQKEWSYHWNEINTPDSADAMVLWLRDAGFEAELVFRDFEVGLILARRK